MPKMKSKRSAVKRLKVTARGKILRNKANRSHILTKKTRKRKRRLKEKALVARSDRKRMRTLIME